MKGVEPLSVRAFCHLKDFCASPRRYDKLAVNVLSTVVLAAYLWWWELW
jgi:hypothetical protein